MAFAIAQDVSIKAESILLQAAKRLLGGVRMRLQRLVEPEEICGRDGSHGGAGVAAEHDPAEVFATYGFRYCQAKVRGTEPLLLEIRDGRSRNLVEPHVLGIERRANVTNGGRLFFGKIFKIRGIEVVYQLNLTALEAQEFEVAVLLDVQSDRIQIRQPLAVRVLFPVVRIAFQQDVRARFVLGDGKGPHDGHLVKEPFKAGDGSWKLDDDIASAWGSHANRAFRGPEGVAGGGMQVGIQQFPHRECDVFRAKRSSVGKGQAIAQVETDLFPTLRYFPGRCQFGFQRLRLPVDPN